MNHAFEELARRSFVPMGQRNASLSSKTNFDLLSASQRHARRRVCHSVSLPSRWSLATKDRSDREISERDDRGARRVCKRAWCSARSIGHTSRPSHPVVGRCDGIRADSAKSASFNALNHHSRKRADSAESAEKPMGKTLLSGTKGRKPTDVIALPR